MKYYRLFGSIAFICVFATLLLGIVMWKDPRLRRRGFESSITEDGVKVVGSEAE